MIQDQKSISIKARMAQKELREGRLGLSLAVFGKPRFVNLPTCTLGSES